MERLVSAPFITLGGRRIASGEPCFVIAEAGVNHNGDADLARALVDAAASAGADAVKFQTFDPEALAAADAPRAAYQKSSSGTGNAGQLEMLRALVLPRALHRELQQRAAQKGILFLSSPFDERSADFLASIGVPALKVPSGELTNLPFIVHLAHKGVPLLMSTGMSTLDEVRAAVEAVQRVPAPPPVALFHCVSSYPARAEDANLRAMATLRTTFGVPAGWSDHTPGFDIAVAAVALGAELIEKHLTLDRSLPGPDHKASLDPAQMTEMIAAVRRVSAALGDGHKRPVEAERETAQVARKSLYFTTTLPAGTTLRREHLVALRPGTGISPARLDDVCGKVLPRAAQAGEMVPQDLLAGVTPT
jgi:N,N'-diacetyllegionaminate synthase